MAEFVMPKLGADMTAGKLLAWRKKVGDSVERGEIIADVETDKADIEVEVFVSGVIERILVQPGERVPVGTLLALIREGGAPVEPPAPPQSEMRPGPSEAPQPAAIPPTSSRPIFSEPGRLRISPAARKLAAQLGIDPASITGSGPDGRITIEDVQRAAPAGDRQERMRQAIAAAMARSKREIPHYYLSTTIDMGKAVEWLTQENLKRPVQDRLLYGVLLIKSVALALREIPELNGVWTEGRTERRPDINVGTAISLRQGGLIAPALRNADRRTLDELMKNFRDLVKRARAGSLRSSELLDSTITVTSLGDQGVETVFGVIYPPQVALVGFGKLVERPWSLEGHIVPRPVITATLSADHRVTDGHRGALFLAAVDRLLQQPGRL